MTGSPRLRALLLVVLVVAVAAAGVFAGRAFRARQAVDRLETTPPPSHGLKIGKPFPTVALLDLDERPLVTDELWRDRGAIVLMIDPECEPCHTMSDRWLSYMRSDSLAGISVVGIAYGAPSGLRAHLRDRPIGFPVYADTAAAFMKQHQVNNVPLCCVVSRSGILQSATFDPEEQVRAADLRAALAR